MQCGNRACDSCLLQPSGINGLYKGDLLDFDGIPGCRGMAHRRWEPPTGSCFSKLVHAAKSRVGYDPMRDYTG